MNRTLGAMGGSGENFVGGAALVGAASIATLLVDPTGMSAFLVGLFGNAAWDGLKELRGGVDALIPRKIVLPNHPLNEALCRAVAKALRFATDSDALQEFRRTPSWAKLTISEQQLVTNFCSELSKVAAGEVQSSILASGAGNDLSKSLLEGSGPEPFDQLKRTIKQTTLYGYPESFVAFFFDRIEKHVGVFFWAEVVGTDPDNGPWREYAALVLNELREHLDGLGEEAAELRRLVEQREGEMKPEEVLNQLQSTVASHIENLSADERSHFEALMQLGLDLSVEVRAGTQATIERIDDVEKGLSGKLDIIHSGIRELTTPTPPAGTPLQALIKHFAAESSEILDWQRVLSTGESIPRSEIKVLQELREKRKGSTTLLLGPPGSGKSALLAEYANSLVESGTPVFGFRSDTLPRGILKFEDIVPTLTGSEDLCESIRRIGAEVEMVVLIDQLDSVSSIVDKHPERLNLLLRFIRHLHKAPGVHIVAACREFEKEHDPRLTHLDYQSIRLELPKWETVSRILGQHDFTIPEGASELREILRTPLHLSDFLKDAEPGDDFSSVQGLLEKVWEKRLETPEEAALLELLARRMLDEEELWIPKSTADGHKEALESLQRKELLTLRSGGLLVGFHHQTYFDFSLARAFSRDIGFSISRHVMSEGHDGLFVRPLLISVLTYLRGTSPSRYHQEINELLGSARLHIRQLVVGLIGSQRTPTVEELGFLIARLDDSDDRPRAIQSLANSQEGVRALLDHGDFVSSGMAGDLSDKNELSGFLTAAFSYFPDDATGLVEAHWLPHESMDRVSCWVLRELRAAGPRQLELLRILARRVNQFDLSRALGSLADGQPEAIPELIALSMEDRVSKARDESAELLRKKRERDQQRETDEPEELWRSAFEHNDYLKPLEKILESEPYFRPSLGSLSDRAPGEVLDHLWPVYCGIVGDLAEGREREGEDASHYREDTVGGISAGYHGPDAFFNAMNHAVVTLARSEPARFLEFVRSTEGSDLMSIHQAIAEGLAELIKTHPNAVLSYLTGDPRRLLLGRRFGDNVAFTRNLVGCAGALKTKECLQLENRLIQFFEDELPVLWIQDPESEDYFHKRCEGLLRNLLAAFPEGTLSPGGQARVAGGELEGDEDDHLIRSRGGIVGPPNTAAELKDRSEDELVQIAEELPDSSGWNNPAVENRWEVEPERSGGAIQQSREYATLAESNPEKFLALLKKFSPGKHELYAASSLEGLAKGGASAGELTEAILSLIDHGFGSRGFRESVTRISEGLAEKTKGLDQRMIEVLLQWLKSEEHPKATDKEDGDSDASGSLVFGQATWVSHGGRESLMGALARAYSVSAEIPDSQWLELIESRLDLEENSDVWATVLSRTLWFFREEPERATALVSQILERSPAAILHPAGSRAIARMLQLAQPVDQAEAWVETFEGAKLDALKLLAGELYPLLAIRSAKARSRLEEFVQQGQKISVPLLRGLVRAIKAIWLSHPEIRPVGLEILKQGMNSGDESIMASASRLLLRLETIPWDDTLCHYVDVLCESDKAVLAGGSELALKLSAEVDRAPAQVHRLGQALLRFGKDRFGDHSTDLPLAPDYILQIAVNLHRIPEYRDEGLDLFEELLRVGFQGAGKALDALQRN